MSPTFKFCLLFLAIQGFGVFTQSGTTNAVPARPPPAAAGVCNLLCVQGYHCKVCPSGPPKCVPDNETGASAAESCATLCCPAGSTCLQNTIECITAPCPQPRPRCVPCGPPVVRPPVDAQSRAQSSGSTINPCPIG